MLRRRRLLQLLSVSATCSKMCRVATQRHGDADQTGQLPHNFPANLKNIYKQFLELMAAHGAHVLRPAKKLCCNCSKTSHPVARLPLQLAEKYMQPSFEVDENQPHRWLGQLENWLRSERVCPEAFFSPPGSRQVVRGGRCQTGTPAAGDVSSSMSEEASPSKKSKAASPEPEALVSDRSW